MKKYSIVIAICLLVMLAVSCATTYTTAKTEKYVIKASEEAKELSKNFKDSGEKLALTEEYFDKVIAKYYGRTSQSFPDVEFKNNLGYESFCSNDVYTLSNGDYENIVLYIHGGAWVFEISEEHVTFCDELPELLNAKVYMPLYPLAPDATYEQAYKMLFELYCTLLNQKKPIYIMGDSAGANLTLCLTRLIKESGYKMPEKLVVISPCADMSFSNPAMTAIDKIDPILSPYGCRECAKLWANGEPLDSPVLSPLYADVSGYPDTLFFHGTSDILYPDAVLFNKKLNASGVNTTFVSGEGLFHVFPTYNIPEKTFALELIRQFCLGN